MLAKDCQARANIIFLTQEESVETGTETYIYMEYAGGPAHPLYAKWSILVAPSKTLMLFEAGR